MGRTKGSKNGISTTPGYVAIGEKAKNQLLTMGKNIAANYAPAANTLKKKLTTKEQNPAMPAATAKYLDKQKAAKEKAMEPQVQQQPIQQPQSQQPAPQQQAQQQPVADKKNFLQELASKIPNQNGNQKQEATTEKPKQEAKKKSGFSVNDLVKTVKQIAQPLAEKAEETVVGMVGPGEIKKTAKKATKEGLDKAIKTYDKREASDKDNLGDFVKADLKDRTNDLKKKGKEYLNNTLARALDDPRIQKDLSELAKTGYKDEKAAVQQLASKLMDSSERRKYASVAADAAVPTYEGRKASDKNKFGDFVKADIQDRINDAKKKGKEKVVDKVASVGSKIVKDKRLQGEMDSFKKDPVGTVQKMVNDAKTNPEVAKKYKAVAADIAVPTYEDRKATTEDSFFDFLMNDIQDRANDAKKKAKKKFING